MDDYVEDESSNEPIDEDKLFPESKSSSKYDYSGPTHENGICLIREAIEEYEERRLGRVVDDSCKNVVLARFDEAHERAREMSIHPYLKLRNRPQSKLFSPEKSWSYSMTGCTSLPRPKTLQKISSVTT